MKYRGDMTRRLQLWKTSKLYRLYANLSAYKIYQDQRDTKHENVQGHENTKMNRGARKHENVSLTNIPVYCTLVQDPGSYTKFWKGGSLGRCDCKCTNVRTWLSYSESAFFFFGHRSSFVHSRVYSGQHACIDQTFIRASYWNREQSSDDQDKSCSNICASAVQANTGVVHAVPACNNVLLTTKPFTHRWLAPTR